uniref:Uncharacterized protein n=1 Tax=Panagrolaimus davidi TaxID=227884 RepID=A0A914QN26_9BILA
MHKSISYLIGTPVTPLNQITIHVIARREDTFEMAEQFLTFILKDDPRFNTSTQQIVDLLVKNVEPEEFFNDRRGKVQRFEKAIRETFRGKLINPYIFDVIPEVRNEPNKLYQHYLKQQKFGSLVKIGTQKFFHPNVKKLVIDLHESPNYCNRSEVIPLNKFFATEFLIDWCAFKLQNMTMIKSLTKVEKYEKIEKSAIEKPKNESSNLKSFMQEESSFTPTSTYHFWESVLIFPFLAVLCIILVLILSVIFFGRREGQHWRDYKTPKEQLQEYLSLRESQKHLRELSVQRQILLMNSDRQKSSTPIGIGTFLQPVQEDYNSRKRNPPKILLDENSERHSVIRKEIENEPLITQRSSVAKQTVAEAAKATGSLLHLYRNPVDDTEEDEEGGDENEDHKNQRH